MLSKDHMLRFAEIRIAQSSKGSEFSFLSIELKGERGEVLQHGNEAGWCAFLKATPVMKAAAGIHQTHRSGRTDTLDRCC